MRFQATLKLHGKTATGMEVPADVVAALGSKRAAVRGTINGHAYRSTVAARGDLFLLPVSAEVRKAAGIAAGDRLDVELELDTEPRELAVPEDFAALLGPRPGDPRAVRRPVVQSPPGVRRPDQRRQDRRDPRAADRQSAARAAPGYPQPMPHGFELTTLVDRPIDEVFAFLAQGTNDPKFSPRVLEIEQVGDGPPGVGTVFRSTVKDAGMKTKREFEITEFEAPSKIRWTERSKNLVTVTAGGYDLAAEGTRRGCGCSTSSPATALASCSSDPAARAANKGADEFGAAIKQAVESS